MIIDTPPTLFEPFCLTGAVLSAEVALVAVPPPPDDPEPFPPSCPPRLLE